MTATDADVPTSRSSRWTIAFVGLAALVFGVVVSESFHSHTGVDMPADSTETSSVDTQYWSRQNSQAIKDLTKVFGTIETKLQKMSAKVGGDDVTPFSDNAAEDGAAEVAPVEDLPAATAEELLPKLKKALASLPGHRAKLYAEIGIDAAGLEKALMATGTSTDWMVNRIGHKLQHPGSKLVLAFTGMSVCAAHGNYYKESYAHVIGDSIREAFEGAGIEVVTRNQCMGGTETFPFSWCMKTFVGGDVDMVGWDFGMMEAGRDWLTDGWLYKTLSLPSQPAAMLFSGYETMESKGKGTGVLTPARQGMVKKLGELGLPVYGMQVGQALKSTYKRKVVNKGTNKENINFDRLDGKPSPPLMTGTREWDSPKGTAGVAPWHPAFKEHRYQGIITADFFMSSLAKALGQTIADLEAAKPAPAAPDNWYPMPVQDILAHTTNCNAQKGSNDMLCKAQFECATEYEPRRGHSLTEIRANDGWKQQISPGDKGPYETNQRVGSGYLDNKMAYCGFRKDGWLDLHLHHVKAGRLIVCEPSYGWSRPDNVALLGEGAEFKAEATAVKIKDEKLVSKFCYEIDRTLNKGGGIFSIRAKSDEKQVCVSFLLWT